MMVVVKKWPFFQLFFCRYYRPGKCLLRYYRTKKMPFQGIKRRSSKSRKIDIFPNGLNHGFGPKMSFTIFQNEETTFQVINTISSKNRRITIFLKGLTHGFGREIAIFFNFFFRGNIGQENVFQDILERKNFSLGYKKKMFKKSKH